MICINGWDKLNINSFVHMGNPVHLRFGFIFNEAIKPQIPVLIRSHLIVSANSATLLAKTADKDSFPNNCDPSML
ncbi:hypothetical protein CEXT_627571 [Caerostris extrusa]|uniref:Uncharacterized protein n=1 Tax=Caerostris extrusa TaxID=172846 RepID=A0AAV4PRP0_CAEEX|nr:hypothetical protein CEXT_627571 [Caerostris extrusa]